MPAAGNRKVRPLLGGIQLQHKPNSITTRNATLGLVYADGMFVTAGHAVGAADTFVGQPDDPSMVGRVVDNHLDAGVDIATVEILTGVQGTLNTIWTGPDTTKTVTFETADRPEEGQLLWIQGTMSGRVGCTVYLPDVTIIEPVTGKQVTNVALLTLDGTTQPGDSGAPVVGRGIKACYGVYGGRVVYEGNTYGWVTPFENLEWD